MKDVLSWCYRRYNRHKDASEETQEMRLGALQVMSHGFLFLSLASVSKETFARNLLMSRLSHFSLQQRPSSETLKSYLDSLA